MPQENSEQWIVVFTRNGIRQEQPFNSQSAALIFVANEDHPTFEVEEIRTPYESTMGRDEIEAALAANRWTRTTPEA